MPAPLILTLALAEADQARFDRLRADHFPPDRLVVGAHVTLFHHLPGEHGAEITAHLAAHRRPAFAVAVTGLRSLGRGVAYALAAPDLAALRGELASIWASWLTPQDRQPFRPHITIQNKADPAAARALLAHLSAGFAPFPIQATGLALWHYRGGPWEPAAAFAFTPPAAAAPPTRHHRSPSSDPS